MIDHLTRIEIVASVRDTSFRRLLQLFRSPEDLTDYVRRAVRRHDWCDAVREGVTPAWERAFAHVVALQDFLRKIEKATRWSGDYTGEPPAPGPVVQPAEPVPVQQLEYVEPPPAPEKRIRPLEAGDVTRTYRGNAGWTNGGISGYRASRSEDDRKHVDGERRIGERPVFGVAAFSEVLGCGGIPELAWYYSASEFEVGMSSNLDAMVMLSATGAAGSGTGIGSAPAGPGAHQIDAATLQREIREALRRVPPRLQAVIETAYEDRCYPTADVTRYGHGIAPLLARASAARRAFLDSPDAQAIRTLTEALCRLSGATKRARDDWEALSPTAARWLLQEAHAAYSAARGVKPPPPPRARRPKRHEPAQIVRVSDKGRGKRQFREVRAA